jgi:hypothetical protein
MTSQEFVLWLKGFSEGVHEYNITPKQWDILKDKLKEVKDGPTPSFPIYPKQPSTTHPNYIGDTPIPLPFGSTSITTGTNNRWSDYQATMAGYKPYQPYTTGGDDEVIKTEE